MTRPAARPAVVTFDVYSALVDAHRGQTAAFAELADRRGWDSDPDALATAWDRRSKALQREAATFVSFRALARRAMADVCAERQLVGDAERDADAVLATVGDWPPYGDVADGVAAVAERCRVALLSNVDDDVLAATNTGYAFPAAVTSEQARVYKPHAGIYRHAEQRLGTPLLHVPASARDVRGALEAGLPVVRVRRGGHELDPQGPQPRREVDDLRDLPALLDHVLTDGRMR